jgi:hypothetical protein
MICKAYRSTLCSRIGVYTRTYVVTLKSHTTFGWYDRQQIILYRFIIKSSYYQRKSNDIQSHYFEVEPQASSISFSCFVNRIRAAAALCCLLASGVSST